LIVQQKNIPRIKLIMQRASAYNANEVPSKQSCHDI
jgi:hypothetical protein